MLWKLFDIPYGAKLCVIYEAGDEASPRAIREARRSTRAGIPRQVYFGRLHRVWRTKSGELVMSIRCSNRDDERTGTPYAYRTFNPKKGALIALHAVS